jgi:dienelactone hydrolase
VRSVAEVLLIHHILGRTDGVEAFAAELRSAGHVVHVPDLFDGHVFDSIEDGFAHARHVGDETVRRRVEAAAAALPAGVVHAGWSWGVMEAQRLAQTRGGARGALLYEACLPITGEWAIGPWPDDVPVQVHGKDDDEFFAHEGDLDAARELVSAVGPDLAELFTYPGDQHLFFDRSLPSFDPDAAELLTRRTLEFLADR